MLQLHESTTTHARATYMTKPRVLGEFNKTPVIEENKKRKKEGEDTLPGDGATKNNYTTFFPFGPRGGKVAFNYRHTLAITVSS